MTKDSIPAFCVLVGVFAVARDRLREARVGRGVDLIALLSLAGLVGTFVTNADPLQYGPVRLPGLVSGDLVTDCVALFLGPIAPFLLGRILFRTAADARALFSALIIGGLIYLPFILVELRMSPQFQNWVYGFLFSDFIQSMRAGGYRPIVFMGHGLALAMFIWSATFAAWTLLKAKEPVFKRSVKPFAVVLSLVLGLLNSLGALLYGFVTVPLSWFTKPKTQLRFACALAFIVMSYPILRATKVFPTKDLVDYAARHSQDRAQSLEFRFDNEDLLLAKALERPVFGWGSWGRNRVFDEDGRDVSVTDGLWVIYFGMGGSCLFVTQFALLLVPLFMALKKVDQLNPANQALLAGAGILSVVHSIDLLPNSGYANMPTFLAGVVAGLAGGMKNEAPQANLWPNLTSLRQAIAMRTG